MRYLYVPEIPWRDNIITRGLLPVRGEGESIDDTRISPNEESQAPFITHNAFGGGVNVMKSSITTSAPNRPNTARIVTSGLLYIDDSPDINIVFHESPVVAPSASISINMAHVVCRIDRISNKDIVVGVDG
jgi:hypothetical protein